MISLYKTFELIDNIETKSSVQTVFFNLAKGFVSCHGCFCTIVSKHIGMLNKTWIIQQSPDTRNMVNTDYSNKASCDYVAVRIQNKRMPRIQSYKRYFKV